MKTLKLTLHPSIKLTRLLVLAWLFFHAMLWCVIVPFLLKLTFITLSLLMLFYYVLRDALLKLPYSFKIIELNLSGEWYVQQVNGRQLKLSIASDSYVSECLTVLHLVQCVPHWRSIFWHRYIILLSDNVDPDLLRQLRVNLLWRHRAKKNAQINVDESS